MRWFRTHIDLGSRLALFALTVQLVLSFGHVHMDKRPPSGVASVGVALQVAGRDGGPATPDHHTGATDVCAICATIGLLASPIPPDPGHLAPPPSHSVALSGAFVIAFTAYDSQSSFQARAPPRSV
jgi:hypothetical protein